MRISQSELALHPIDIHRGETIDHARWSAEDLDHPKVVQEVHMIRSARKTIARKQDRFRGVTDRLRGIHSIMIVLIHRYEGNISLPKTLVVGTGQGQEHRLEERSLGEDDQRHQKYLGRAQRLLREDHLPLFTQTG